MQNLLHANKDHSTDKIVKTQEKNNRDKEIWKEYSTFHDSFTEILSYENNYKSSPDIWQLNYI